MQADVERMGGRPVVRARWRRRLVVAVVLFALCLLVPHTIVVASGGRHVLALDAVPAADCIVVPGARIHADGTPYHLLIDRLELARVLYERGRAKVLVLSGRGGGGLAVDEVGAMRRWLETRGVPATAIVDDGLGLRTIDTMRRCKVEFGMRSAIVATNGFHASRCVFLARAVGLDAVAVAATEGFAYSLGTRCKNVGREVFARVWAFGEVWFGAIG